MGTLNHAGVGSKRMKQSPQSAVLSFGAVPAALNPQCAGLLFPSAAQPGRGLLSSPAHSRLPQPFQPTSFFPHLRGAKWREKINLARFVKALE